MKVNHILLVAVATIVSSTAIPELARRGGSVSVTPHDKYQSFAGVLGCMINPNRVAYWPDEVSCDELCLKISYGGRHVNVLRIDTSRQSGKIPAAHDISYDAWIYLQTSQTAKDQPLRGGGISVTWENVPISDCADILSKAGGKLPLSAANGMNYFSGCGPETWAHKNAIFINAFDTQCKKGYNEECILGTDQNQPTCPSGKLGATIDANGHPLFFPGGPVIDLEYGTGKEVPAV